MRPHPVKRLAVCSVAAVLPVLLAAAPATATVTSRSPNDSFQNNALTEARNGVLRTVGHIWPWLHSGVSGPGRRDRRPHRPRLRLRWRGALERRHQNCAGVLAVSNDPIQPDPAQAELQPGRCSSLDTWADYQMPYLNDVNGGCGRGGLGAGRQLPAAGGTQGQVPRTSRS